MKKKANVKDISALVKHWLVFFKTSSWWRLVLRCRESEIQAAKVHVWQVGGHGDRQSRETRVAIHLEKTLRIFLARHGLDAGYSDLLTLAGKARHGSPVFGGFGFTFPGSLKSMPCSRLGGSSKMNEKTVAVQCPIVCASVFPDGPAP